MKDALSPAPVERGGAKLGPNVGPRFGHAILTRFNLRWDEAPDGPSIGTDPAWLANRFDLFERYCLPTLLRQTRRDFRWILFFDHQTPAPFAERAAALAQAGPGIVPMFCKTLSNQQVSDIVAGLFDPAPEWLLTTRLDNDDGLHEDFVARVQDAQTFARAEVLNCPEGVVLSGERTYRQRHLSNAFISLSEPFAERRTILSIARHVYAGESYPVRQVAGGPMWLQVIHGGNVSNRVRGRRAPFAAAAPGFAPLADRPPPPDESRAAILAENLTADLARSAADLARIAVRRSAKLVGLDVRRRAKLPRAGAAG